MNNRFNNHSLKLRGVVVTALLATGLACVALTLYAKSQTGNSDAKSNVDLLDGFRHVEAASVSDAIEQLPGRKCICRTACGRFSRPSLLASL